jgi:hypothetical protein
MEMERHGEHFEQTLNSVGLMHHFIIHTIGLCRA